MATPESTQIEVTVRGTVSDAERDSAVEKLRGALGGAPRPVLFVRIELSMAANPAVERPAVVKAMVDVSGRPVRAHLAAATMEMAIDGVVDRIRRNIRRLAERREDRVQKPAITEAGEWQHGGLPTDRPDYFPRPASEREVVRRKSYAVAHISPEEAGFEMDLLDHDFHLFVDATSGADAVLARREDGELEVHSADGEAGRGPAGEPADLEVLPVSTMTAEGALGLLNVGDERFVAYVDADTGRLNLVYRRYDGHYGLVAPDDAT